MSYTSPEIAMIVLAGIVVFCQFIWYCFKNKLEESLFKKMLVSVIFVTGILLITVLSIGINDGSEEQTLFISYISWSCAYLATVLANAEDIRSLTQSTYELPLNGLWLVSVFITAVVRAAYGKDSTELDTNGLCIFGLVGTILLGGPYSYKAYCDRCLSPPSA